jgi:PIN domain nuclease of toxin-antitoxin system
VDTPVFVIDTHPLVWYFEDSPKLSSMAKEAFESIEKGTALGVVPTIVLAEIVHLADRKRIPVTINDTITRLKQSTNFGIVSLDLMVILLMVPLKAHEIHDRVIIATAKSFEASLITKDENIRSSGVIPCIW